MNIMNILGVSNKRKAVSDVVDNLDNSSVKTKRLRIGVEPEVYTLPEAKGNPGDVMVAQSNGNVLWEHPTSAGSALIETLVLDPLNGGAAPSFGTILSPNSQNRFSTVLDVPTNRWQLLNDNPNLSPGIHGTANIVGQCYAYVHTVLPIVNAVEGDRLILRVYGFVGGREVGNYTFPGQEAEWFSNVYAWIQQSGEAPPVGDDPDHFQKFVRCLQVLKPSSSQVASWSNTNGHGSPKRYDVEIDPLNWMGKSVRIGLCFKSSRINDTTILQQGCQISDFKILVQSLGNGVATLPPGMIQHQDLQGTGTLTHANIDSYLDQEVKTTSNPTFNSVNVQNWSLSQTGGFEDFELRDNNGQSRYVFGGHATGGGINTMCIYSAINSQTGGGFRNYRSRGTLNAPTACLDGDNTHLTWAYAHNGSAHVPHCQFRFRAIGDQTPTNSGSYFELRLTRENTNGAYSFYRLRPDGFGIGQEPNGYILPIEAGYPGQMLKLGDDGKTMQWDTVGKYSQITDVTVVNTADRILLTPLSAIAKGSPHFPPNVLVEGDCLHVRISGTIGTEDNKDQEVDLNLTATSVEQGEIIIHQTSFVDLNEVKGQFPWEWEVDLQVQEIAGATSRIHCNSQFSYSGKADSNGGKLWNSNSETLTLDTTILQTLGVWAQWQQAHPDNYLDMKMCVMTKTF